MSAPVLRRYYSGDCTRCGRSLDRTPRPNSPRMRILAGVVPAEVVRCARCTNETRTQGYRRDFEQPGGLAMTRITADYAAALVEWANS